jgi:hypothetical protein
MRIKARRWPSSPAPGNAPGNDHKRKCPFMRHSCVRTGTQNVHRRRGSILKFQSKNTQSDISLGTIFDYLGHGTDWPRPTCFPHTTLTYLGDVTAVLCFQEQGNARRTPRWGKRRGRRGLTRTDRQPDGFKALTYPFDQSIVPGYGPRNGVSVWMCGPDAAKSSEMSSGSVWWGGWTLWNERVELRSTVAVPHRPPRTD